ncbi:MAG: glycosyltransferase family 4 protein [Dermabacter sp.]|nr:glycosyltransferase family 4 protein [Dermabacter sp.]
MTVKSQLVVLLADGVIEDSHGVHHLATKTYEGLCEYAKAWPGEVVAVAPSHRGTADPAVTTRIAAGASAFSLVIADSPEDVQRARRTAAVTLALHGPHNAYLMDHAPDRLVFTHENPLSERLRMGRVQSSTPLQAARSTLGWLRKAPRLRSMLARAGGVQSNGYPAHLAVGALNPRPLLYFDTRVSRAQLAEHPVTRESLEAKLAESPRLRLGFSGRHTEEKGPAYALGAHALLRGRGIDATLTFYGEGAQTAALRAQAAGDDSAIFRGSLPYGTAWVPEVAREIDVMVLPHTQGDPAGTYLEAAALGVPVVSFQNRAFAELSARHGIGWAEPMKNSAALADRLAHLHEHREEIVEAGLRGRAFMQEHTFEDEFAARIRHLREVGQV